MDMATPALAKHGSQYVRETFLRPSISGDLVACLGVSEPGAGSDVAQIKVRLSCDYLISRAWTVQKRNPQFFLKFNQTTVS